ncbi:hypothetical protein GCM10007972_06670 [Iodidimonas muriae]|uniref:DUF4136 domain-containing protein n=1 Tax=Iodidimonas muriae TaxID=261467 RepID=A0ABQ2L904_9PROT|nr:DUF4136 domain-containing protein [Iodidimonas muriae]GER05906.1 hypothetical protein JCM17843_02160 [Kordiimonadales bacterium JCM 17843]GGO07348.1 hypothetical protein GCM10007972_06670 [Iodidimonas muriae]
MPYRLITAILLLSAFVLAGCARTFEADVARFHRLSAPQQQTVKIVAIDPDKQGSLEFEQYAGLVRAQLIDAGYRPTEGDADITVEFDWLVSEGREKVFSRPNYYGGYPYYGHGFFHPYGFRSSYYGGYYGGYGGYGYGGNQVYSVTVHSVRMTVAMVRSNDEVVFEGRADTTISNNDVPSVMPFLVQAMFTGFPGQSGQTQTVELKLPKGSKSSSTGY